MTGCDWFPTIAELCEVPLSDRRIDGKSITAVLQSAEAESPHDHFYWLLGRGKGAQWAVRKGDWKLLGNPADRSDRDNKERPESPYLVNLGDDIGERTNVANKYPEIVRQLEAIHQRHSQSIAAGSP